MKNFILLLVGMTILQFFIGLVIYQIGFENGIKFDSPSIIFEYCLRGKTLKYGSDEYAILCLLK